MADYVVVDKEQLEADLTMVSDSIRGLIETEEKLAFPQGMKEAVESYSLDEPLTTQDALIEQIKTALQGKASGGGSEFGESYWVENLSGRDSYNNVFVKWKSEKIPLIDTSKATSMQRAFDYANIKELPPLDFTNVKDCYAVFNHCESLTKVPLLNLASATRADNMFGCCSVLESIEVENTSNITNWNYFASTNPKLKSVKTLDLSVKTTTGDLFQNSQNIETLLFVPNTIKISITFVKLSKLSEASIQSIIDGLADLTGLETQTLTLHADVKAKLTEDQITTITSKNWTLA